MKDFDLGNLYLTRGINEEISADEQFADDINTAMQKYRNCDWGEIPEEDLKSNDLAIETGEDRILASYDTNKGAVWIITECDRSATTIFFPREY